MSQAFTFVASGTEAADATVDTVIVPARLACRSCGQDTETSDVLAACPSCNSDDVEHHRRR